MHVIHRMLTSVSQVGRARKKKNAYICHSFTLRVSESHWTEHRLQFDTQSDRPKQEIKRTQSMRLKIRAVSRLNVLIAINRK